MGLLLQRLALSLPVVDMLHDDPRRGLGRILATDTLDEVSFGIWNQRVSTIRGRQKQQEGGEKKNSPIK